MVGVAVSAVVAVGKMDAAQQGFTGDEIQLVPVVGSEVPPGYSVVWLGGEECVGYAKVMVSAQL